MKQTGNHHKASIRSEILEKIAGWRIQRSMQNIADVVKIDRIFDPEEDYLDYPQKCF